ncbi:uncharacterized protein LOC123429775 [Hordeum vulgare subsp. vulgare]|uniref:uncharacterized protein LOC123429775 n=1 Tax=Hordeum vulgare subsp. vulgare TaxID=112509 RepID=UPI001D1A3F3F|nr:uncharacterized protein LOC123429775 [Hordeum vulgare subsp. vulgare]KAI5012426.1 hypothetical protein ZWY2020_024560 [Hordeum vulgare]
MEGLIPFVIDAIRKSHGRDSYRRASSDGSSHGGSGSRCHLIDYRELPAGAADADASRHRGPWSEFIEAPTDVRRPEDHARTSA